MGIKTKNQATYPIGISLCTTLLVFGLLILPFWREFLPHHQRAKLVKPEQVELDAEAFTIPSGQSIQGNPQLNHSGTRALFVLSQEAVDAPGAYNALYLWERGSGFRRLSEDGVQVLTYGTERAVGFTSDGTRALYFGKTDSMPAVTAKLYIWEEGAGSSVLLERTFEGPWSLALAGSGERALLFPQTAKQQGAAALALRFPPRISSPSGAVFPPKVIVESLAHSSSPLATVLDGALETRIERTSANSVAVRRQRSGLRAAVVDDVNGDQRSDLLTVVRGQRSTLLWRGFFLEPGHSWNRLLYGSAGKYFTWQLGDPAGVPVPGDYNGDGALDLATFTPGYGTEWHERPGPWALYLSNPLNNGLNRFGDVLHLRMEWGHSDARAVPGDYDADGTTDLAYFMPENGMWYMLYAKDDFQLVKAHLRDPMHGTAYHWGQAGDVPVPADYNGDGRTDIAIWRVMKEPGDQKAQWHIGILGDSLEGQLRELGRKGDIPFAADLDCDGSAEPMVYRPEDGHWLVWRPSGSPERLTFGAIGDLPIVGDFDADGCSDVGLFSEKGEVRWKLRNSSRSSAREEALSASLPKITELRWGEGRALPAQWVLKLHQMGH